MNSMNSLECDRFDLNQCTLAFGNDFKAPPYKSHWSIGVNPDAVGAVFDSWSLSPRWWRPKYIPVATLQARAGTALIDVNLPRNDPV